MKRRSKATKTGRRRVKAAAKPRARKAKRAGTKAAAPKAGAKRGKASVKVRGTRARSAAKGKSTAAAPGRKRKASATATAARAPRRARRSAAAAKPARTARAKTPPKPAASKPATAFDSAREIRRLQSARRDLERQLTAAVQEIGILRQWEVRAQLLESELEKRNERLRELEERLGGADLVRQPRLL